MISTLIFFLCIIPSIYFTFLLICIIKNRVLVKDYPNADRRLLKQITFQITTNGRNFSTVVDTVNHVRAVAPEVAILVVTDEGSPVNYAGCEVMAVPKSFKCKARFKARNLCYAVKHRNYSKWVYFLDDESRPTEQCVRALCNHVEQNSNIPIAQGLISYPNNFTRASLLTRIADSIRPTGCHECKTLIDAKMVTHLHGSNLLVRTDVEKEIGWDFDTIAEDSMFGFEAQRRGYAIGWHYGLVEEQPVFTVKDLARQRRRWLLGQLQNLKSAPMKIKIVSIAKISSWMLGFPISVLTIGGTAYLLFTHNLRWDHSWNLLMVPGTVTWFMMYQLGLTWNMKCLSSRKDRIITRILAVCLIWVVSLIETYPAITFFLEYGKGFSTVQKDTRR